MKDNINIEELFKSKLENFEGNVDSSAWVNISQGIGTNGSVATTTTAGISKFSKVALITGLIGLSSISAWYFSSTKDKEENVITEATEETKEVLTEKDKNIISTKVLGDNILVNDTNDPVIKENVNQIQEDLSDIQTQIDLHPEIINDKVVEELFGINLISDINKGTDIGRNIGNINLEDKETVVINEDPIQDHERDHDNTENQIIVDLKHDLYEKELLVQANALNYSKIIWDFGDGTVEEGPEFMHKYERPGAYTVTLKVEGEQETVVQSFEITIEGTSSMDQFVNVFTPSDRDGTNDVFFIKSKDIQTFYISIRDNKGLEVFTSTDPDFEWNGENQFGEIVTGNYMYMIIAEGNDGQIFKDQGALVMK